MVKSKKMLQALKMDAPHLNDTLMPRGSYAACYTVCTYVYLECNTVVVLY